MATIKLNTGIKRYEFEDENGNKLGSLSLNPSDFNLAGKVQNFQVNMEEILKNLPSSDTEMSELQIIALLTELDTKVRHEINELFSNDKASDVVFGNQSSLNIIDGETLAQRFLKAFIPVLVDDIEAQTKSTNDKISKYTEGIE